MAAALYHLHRWLGRRGEVPLGWLVMLCFVMSLAAAPIWALVGFGVYSFWIAPLPAIWNWLDFGYDMVYGGGLFFGWSCLFITLLYSFDLRERERRLAALREEALSAQMRALRYQVNPHFLFNTLNSIAGLIEEGADDRAGRMVMSLSTFLRTTLALDPMSDVPLSDEVALQGDYLAIERERFSDRMALRIDLPDELRGARVPSLILQPLIENAVKHGVGRATGRVEISLTARREANRLRLTVENDMPDGELASTPSPGRAPAAGTGLGLRNVADRLRARYQEAGVLEAGVLRAEMQGGPVPDGRPALPLRYRAALDLPFLAG
jgi:LytS/YehU family sensor histidine kinase